MQHKLLHLLVILKSYQKSSLYSSNSTIYSTKRAPIREAYKLINSSLVIQNLKKEVDKDFLNLIRIPTKS